MRIALTGSSGFIGKRVARCALEQGHAVWPFDREAAPAIDLTRVPLDFSGQDTIIHLAARADVRNNWNELHDIERDNVTATLRTLDAARKANVKSFVFVSTGAVYARAPGYVTEDTVVVASSPYAASKLAGEAYLQAYAERCGWNWYVVRLAACFGTGYHHGHVRDFVDQARDGNPVLTLDDGRTMRPAVHVDDVADILVSLADGSRYSGIYNVTGGLWSWRNTIEVMSDLCGSRVKFIAKQRPNGWIGDGHGATWDGAKLRAAGLTPKRRVVDGVIDAVRGLGWPS